VYRANKRFSTKNSLKNPTTILFYNKNNKSNYQKSEREWRERGAIPPSTLAMNGAPERFSAHQSLIIRVLANN
jgi:hypothetical protein